jgi:hypothetical protein
MSYSLSSNFVPVEWFLAELWLLNLYFCSNFKLSVLFFDVLWYIDLIFGMWLYLDDLQTKNTSSRAIAQPNIIRPERNSSFKCNSSRYSQIPNINQRTSRKTLDNLKFGYIDLIFDMLLYLDELQFKFEFLCGRMTFLAELWPLNLYFCSNFKLSGLFNSAKSHSTGTKFELKL